MKKKVFVSAASLVVVALGLVACATERAGYDPTPSTVAEDDGAVELRNQGFRLPVETR